MSLMVSCEKKAENPFLMPYNTPFDVPPFDKIKVEHYEPAILEGIKQHTAEIDAITSNAEAPTFENTIVPLDYSGQLLENVLLVMLNMGEAYKTPELQEVIKKTSPILSKHNDDISMNAKLFERVKVVYEGVAAGNYSPEQKLLIE
ncbi:MAG TPA: peptidase M3, partial [Tenuifilaceae bacterium]|nr:peptidase M3 [Tenuifilaceae bacterium]